MSKQLISLLVLVMALFGSMGIAYAQQQPISPDIFRLEISECTHLPEVIRYQTGFRVVGTVGIVTALHGVADDCQTINAVGDSGNGPVFNNLDLIEADVDRDVALLSSDEVKAAKNEPQLEHLPEGEMVGPSDSCMLLDTRTDCTCS